MGSSASGSAAMSWLCPASLGPACTFCPSAPLVALAAACPPKHKKYTVMSAKSDVQLCGLFVAQRKTLTRMPKSGCRGGIGKITVQQRYRLDVD